MPPSPCLQLEQCLNAASPDIPSVSEPLRAIAEQVEHEMDNSTVSLGCNRTSEATCSALNQRLCSRWSTWWSAAPREAPATGATGLGQPGQPSPTPSHWSWFVMPALQLPLPLPPAVEAGALRTFTPPTCPLQLSPSVHVSSSQHPMMHAALTIRPYVPHPTPLPCSCRCRPRLRWGSCAPSRSGRCASCTCCTGVPWEAPRKGCGCLRLRHAPASGMSGGWPEGVREDSW